MSDIIRLLPDSVANQIAAGEVIQRPASVIKELVENAVDAGATDVRVIVRDAGRTLIQVIDNGRGMSPTDARMAFERHATSKIRQADDLFSLRTMGFRGEALPSICAISRVELRSRTAEDTMGTCLVINGSQVESQEPVVCDAGTNIQVKNIFFNVPARRKFLKSDNVELANIMREFERLALVNNNIRMSIDTGSREVRLRAGSFHQRIGELWKGNLSMTLLPVEIDTDLVRISGFVSRPEFARRRNPLQFMIANGRNMRHPFFHKAIMQCYDSLIAPDTQPCYFLKFEVDPSAVDVNISPTKNEVKFEHEAEIRPLLVAAVRASLGKYGAVPSIDFESAPIEVSPLSPGENPVPPSAGVHSGYSPFNDAVPADFAVPAAGPTWQRRGAEPRVRGWESLYKDFMEASRGDSRRRDELPPAAPQHDASALPGMDVSSCTDATHPAYMQVLHKYIVFVSGEGLFLIDQHRAHFKVLYEQFMANASSGAHPSQGLVFPELAVLDNTQALTLSEVSGDLSRLGFVLERESDSTWRIVSVPAVSVTIRPAEILLKILDAVREGASPESTAGSAADSILSRMATVMARSAAIMRGRVLSPSEMEELCGALFRLPDPAYTPLGNRVFRRFDDDGLAALLK